MGSPSALRRLAITQSLFQSSGVVANVFLSLYLFRAKSITTVSIMQSVACVVLAIVMIGCGIALRKTNTRTLIRIGCYWMCGMFLCILLAGDRVANAPWLLGILYGIGLGCFWSGFNISEYSATHDNNRTTYFAMVMRWAYVLPALSQFVAAGVFWLLVHYATVNVSYYAIFALLTVMYGVTAVIAEGVERHSGSRFQWGSLASHLHDKRWQYSLLQNAFMATLTFPLTTYVPALLFVYLQRESYVSTFSGLVTVFVGIVSPFVGRFLLRRPQGFWFGAAAIPLGLVGFAALPTIPAVMAYALGYVFGNLFLVIPMRVFRYEAQELLVHDWRDGYHFFMQGEIMLNSFRVLSFALVLGLAQLVSGEMALRITIASLGLMAIPVGILISRGNRLMPTTDLGVAQVTST